MRRDPTLFRERFNAWKAGEKVYDKGLPCYRGGKEGENERYTNYPIPFIDDKAVTLTNAGLATGARLSTNMLDSIADNAVKADLPIKTAIGLAVKESTLGNPTDDTSVYKILRPSVAKRFKELGTGQHINTKGDWVFGDELVNYYVDEKNKYPNGMMGEDTYYPSTLYKAFKYFKDTPRKYNPGLKNHPELVKKRAEETWKSPEVKQWFKEYNKNKTELLKRPKPYKITIDWDSLPRYRWGTEGDDVEELIKKRLEQQSDNAVVQRQEPVLPIKRLYGKVVDPKLIERKQLQQPVIKEGNTYKVKPRPQTFAGRVALVIGKDWVKTDAKSAAIGMGLSLIPAVGPALSAAWGAPDFGYDLNESMHNYTDQEAHGNTAMSGLALLPYVRGGLKMLKGKTWTDRLRNAYDLLMTRYNASKDVNKALKTGRIADSVQDAHGLDWSSWSNGDFNLLDPNIYKMPTPAILAGAGYGIYNKYAE